MPYYFVKDNGGIVNLFDKNKNETNFEEAYIIYNEEKIDITDCIRKEQENCYVVLGDVVDKLTSIGKIEMKMIYMALHKHLNLLKMV